jgi:hypothetical protein
MRSNTLQESFLFASVYIRSGNDFHTVDIDEAAQQVHGLTTKTDEPNPEGIGRGSDLTSRDKGKSCNAEDRGAQERPP